MKTRRTSSFDERGTMAKADDDISVNVLSPEDWLFSALLDMVIARCSTTRSEFGGKTGLSFGTTSAS
jgi:hypothetical protein